jgi:hypothetical protein
LRPAFLAIAVLAITACGRGVQPNARQQAVYPFLIKAGQYIDLVEARYRLGGKREIREERFAKELAELEKLSYVQEPTGGQKSDYVLVDLYREQQQTVNAAATAVRTVRLLQVDGLVDSRRPSVPEEKADWVFTEARRRLGVAWKWYLDLEQDNPGIILADDSLEGDSRDLKARAVPPSLPLVLGVPSPRPNGPIERTLQLPEVR